MPRDIKGKGKEIQEVRHDEAQGSHWTEPSLVEPFAADPKVIIIEENSRPGTDVDGRKPALGDVLRSDPLEIQIKDILILANDSGDGDALRRAAILNAQFQAVAHTSNVPGLYSVDGAYSEDSGYATNKSECSSPERPPSVRLQEASRAPLVGYDSAQNKGKRPISNVSASLNDSMSRISTAETTFPEARPRGDDRKGLGIWEYLFGFCCFRIWAMPWFRRSRAHQDNRQHIDGSSAAQKLKAKEDEQATKETRQNSKESERTGNQIEEGVGPTREQCQRTGVTVQEAKRAKELQKQNCEKTGHFTERGERAYSTSSMHDFNKPLHP